MTLPSFIGIGAHKAGTTWLYSMLAQNPSIWLPPLKEVHFFDRQNATSDKKRAHAAHIRKVADRLEARRRSKGSGDNKADKVAFLRALADGDVLSDEWYRSIFSHPDAEGKITGEITPSYLDVDAAALPKFKAMLPDTKFLLIVRDPQARSLSQIRMGIANSGQTPETDGDWEYFIGKLSTYLRGNYKTAIPLWQSHVGIDRLLIQPFGRIKHEPAALIRTIEDFIGATPFDGYKAMAKRIHKTKEIEIPDWVRNRIEEMTRPQRDYLIEAFGQDFYEQTR